MRQYLIADLYEGNNVASPQLLAEHVQGVWLKASEGANFTDHAMRTRLAILESTRVHCGLYHYARPELNSAAVEAAHFAGAIQTVHRRDLRPALDFESPAALRLGGRALTTWARNFCREVKRLTGVLPLFYSYPDYIRQMRPDTTIGAGLWLAQYGRNTGEDFGYNVPLPWRAVSAHQFSSRGTLPGVVGPVDLTHARSLGPLLAHPVAGRL